ncbi:MAG TPA: hypothetical protein VNX68_03830 [Nitrosopumilaceae archaeon]|nr:hypothetical protein [Nitrosopumilaceae archaeon]
MISLGRLFLVLILLCQEPGYWQKPPVIRDPDRTVEQLKETNERNDILEFNHIKHTWKLILESTLLERFLAPIDEWILMSGPNTEDLSEIKWYILLIRSENKYNGTDIWIKFYLVDTDCQIRNNNNDFTYTITNTECMRTKRDGLKAALEHHMIQLLNEDDAKVTMRDGTAHLYRIPTDSFPIDKINKSMLIY